jgi:peptidoglycan/LPS O-acetylase OafA/YrhL
MSINNDALPQKRGYIPALDGIRAIAILLVLFSHCVIYDQFTQLHNIGLQLGSLGVSVFFVLSGYLITRSLIEEEERIGSISLKFFYIRRAFRLLPALWVYLLIVSCLWLAHLLPNDPWHSFVSSLLYIRNIIGHGHATAHLWSLSVEEQFYFLWPIILIKFPNQNRKRLIITLIIIMVIVLWRYFAITKNLATPGDIYIRTDFRLDSPLIGCLLALFEKENLNAPKFKLSSFGGSILLILTILLIGCWTLIQLQFGDFFGISSTLTSTLGGVLIYSQICTKNSIFRGGLASPLLVSIGKISYAIYLWQALFLAPTSEPLGFLRVFPVNILLCFGCGILSFYFIEKPFLKIKEKSFHK